MYFNRTLLKFGGGFLPLHKFERAHTAFLVVVSLFEFVNNLPRKRKKELSLYFHFSSLAIFYRNIHILSTFYKAFKMTWQNRKREFFKFIMFPEKKNSVQLYY